MNAPFARLSAWRIWEAIGGLSVMNEVDKRWCTYVVMVFDYLLLLQLEPQNCYQNRIVCNLFQLVANAKAMDNAEPNSVRSISRSKYTLILASFTYKLRSSSLSVAADAHTDRHTTNNELFSHVLRLFNRFVVVHSFSPLVQLFLLFVSLVLWRCSIYFFSLFSRAASYL